MTVDNLSRTPRFGINIARTDQGAIVTGKDGNPVDLNPFVTNEVTRVLRQGPLQFVRQDDDSILVIPASKKPL